MASMASVLLSTSLYVPLGVTSVDVILLILYVIFTPRICYFLDPSSDSHEY
ncbi:hypothetical protein FRB91_006172 [Serendipita sp. 411]|nr:hypothetical protein FRB91_006172 [Serendipita sp. 411]